MISSALKWITDLSRSTILIPVGSLEQILRYAWTGYLLAVSENSRISDTVRDCTRWLAPRLGPTLLAASLAGAMCSLLCMATMMILGR